MIKRITAIVILLSFLLGGCGGHFEGRVLDSQPVVIADSPPDDSPPVEPPRTGAPTDEVRWLSDGIFLDPSRGWVVLNAKIILYTADGGATWEEVYVSPTTVSGLQFVSATSGWALEEGRLVATEDGGRSWRVLSADAPTFHRISLVAGIPTWGIGSHWLYTSSDQGQTWAEVATPCDDAALMALSFITADVGWIICTGEIRGIGWLDKELYRTDDAGRSWRLVAAGGYDVRETGGMPGGYLGDLFFLDENHGWYSEVRHGALYATADGGHSWQHLPGLAGQAVTALHFTATAFGSVLNSDNGLQRLMTTPDGGATWTQRFP